MKYLFFSFLVICVACKSETSSKTAEISVDKPVQKASPILSEDLSVDELIAHPWEVQVVLNNGRIEEDSKWKDSELQFKEDGTYTWNDEKGKYTLDSSNNIIHLQASDVTLNSEWSIKHRQSVMVWIGTPKYSLQAIQLKLEKPRNVVKN